MIIIDGITYDVPIIAVDASADFLDKYAQRTESGDLERELIGVYFNQSITFGRGTKNGEFGRLYDKLTEPTEFHEVTINTPLGVKTQIMYPSSIKTKLIKLKESDSWWGGLTVNFTSKTPSRK